MKIEKDQEPGLYLAKARVEGELFIGLGDSHTKAMERCFSKITWQLGIK